MRLPDFARSRAVIACTAKYEVEELDNLPSVAQSAREFREVLLSPELAGFSKANCTQIIDPNSQAALLAPISTAADEAEDLFLLYFGGHGLLLGSGRLHLALTTTRESQFWTAVPFDDVARIIQECQARTKVLILDCCYSGQAMQSAMMGSNAAEAASRQLDLDVDGLYVMTSTSPTKTSLAPKGSRYTAFTGALIETMRTGIHNGDPFLPLERLYGEVFKTLRQAGLPKPQQHNRNNAGKMALVRNLHYDGGAPEPLVVDLDLSNSGAVVIGTEHYENPAFPPLHSAANDANDIAEALTNSETCGITQLSLVIDPTTFDSVLGPVQQIAQAARDTFVLYLSGHSWVSPTGEFHMVLSSSDPDRPWTLLPVRYLSEAIQSSRAEASVIIVDTSYSMRLAQSLDLGTNLYFIAAAGPASSAFADAEHGHLTQRVLDVLRAGIDHAEEHLTPLDLFRAVELMPGPGEPRLAIYNGGRPPCLFRNRSTLTRKEPGHRCG